MDNSRLSRIVGFYYSYLEQKAVLEVQGRDDLGALATLHPTVVILGPVPDVKGAMATKGLLGMAAWAAAIVALLALVAAGLIWRWGLS